MSLRYGGIAGTEFVETDASQEAGAIPLLYLPSAMVHNSFPQIWDKFGVIPGPWGIIRGPVAFFNGVTGYLASGTNASSDAQMLSRTQLYFEQDIVQKALERGTLVIEVHTFQHKSSNPNGQWRFLPPQDLSVGGSYQQSCQVFFDYVFNALGVKPAQFVGDTGLIIQGLNEVDSADPQEQWQGTPTEYRLMTHRCYSALKAVRPTAKFIAPTVLFYSGDVGTEGTPAVRTTCDYFAANGMELAGIDIHTFQGISEPVVKEAVYAAQILVQQSLAANNLPLDTQVISSEYQNNTPEADVRSTEICAAYLASTLFEHRRAGWTAACMAALLNLGGSVHPDLFADTPGGNSIGSWGMIAWGVVQSGWAVTTVAVKPSFMLMKLFSLWGGGRELRSTHDHSAGSSANGISVFSARNGNDIFQLVSRWDRAGVPRNIHAAIKNFSGNLIEIRIYRFNGLVNNPKHVFEAAPGTADQRAAAAIAAGDNPTYTTQASMPVILDMESREAAFIHYRFA